jgi:hypothetical protein
MARHRVVVAIVVTEAIAMLLALVVASQAGAGQPTAAAWATAANRACVASYAKVKALPRPTTAGILITDLRATLRISKQLTRQLTLIPAPESKRRMIGRLVTLANSGNSIVEQKLLPALLNGDEKAATRLAAQSNQIGARFNTIARALGARICAENPAPQG